MNSSPQRLPLTTRASIVSSINALKSRVSRGRIQTIKGQMAACFISFLLCRGRPNGCAKQQGYYQPMLIYEFTFLNQSADQEIFYMLGGCNYYLLTIFEPPYYMTYFGLPTKKKNYILQIKKCDSPPCSQLHIFDWLLKA